MAREPRVEKGPPGPVGRGAQRSASPGLRRRPIPLEAFLEDPRTRIATIPLVLWVCAAVVAHLAGGGGAMEAAVMVHERDELRAAVRAERAGFRAADTTIELLSDNAEPTPQPIAPPKEEGTNDGKMEAEADPEAPKLDPPKSEAPKPPPPAKEKDKPEPPKVEPPKPEPPKPEPPKPKPEPLKPLAPVAAAPAAPPPPPPPPPEMDHRQAVRQIVKKDQEDNPTAKRIADDANKVDKETMARARAQDQDSPKPSMGASKGGPKDEIGNDKDEHSGSAEDHKGDEKHAPGEKKADATDAEHEAPRPPVPPTPNQGPPPSIPGQDGKGARGVAVAPQGPPPSPGGAGPASPEVVASEKGGNYTLDPANPGGDGRTRIPGRKRPPNAFQTPVHVGAIGLGGTGLPGGPQLNLNMAGVEAAVGNEQLSRERAADGAARRAAHRGKWEKNRFDKFKPAIENYEPSVTLDNTTSLNAAASPFATYIHSIHNRIHPIFAEEDLEFYNSRPKTEKVNDMSIAAHLEIVLDKTTGRIVRMGVTKTSGITDYDLTALNAVDRAAPFGKAPDLIASPDDNVYLHWEFHRDPFDACTTRNARPFILKTAPKKPAAAVGPVRKLPGAKDDRTAPSGPLVPIQEH